MISSTYQLVMTTKGETSESLSARWLTADGKALAEAVRNAVTGGADIPDEVAFIEGACNGHVMKLADLRGIDFSRLVIGDVDLAACCFDDSNFSGTTLNRTSFQYSSFKNANFQNTEWNAVQASPISADGASFRSARIASSFFMCSHLVGANFDDAEIKETDLAGSALGSSKLSRARSLHGVDITQIFLSDTDEEFALQGKGGTTGKALVQKQPDALGNALSRPYESTVAASLAPQTMAGNEAEVKTHSFGSPDALLIVLKWRDAHPSGDPIDTTYGELQLWLRNTLVWGERDANGKITGIGGNWIELLEFLANA